EDRLRRRRFAREGGDGERPDRAGGGAREEAAAARRARGDPGSVADDGRGDRRRRGVGGRLPARSEGRTHGPPYIGARRRVGDRCYRSAWGGGSASPFLEELLHRAAILLGRPPRPLLALDPRPPHRAI